MCWRIWATCAMLTRICAWHRCIYTRKYIRVYAYMHAPYMHAYIIYIYIYIYAYIAYTRISMHLCATNPPLPHNTETQHVKIVNFFIIKLIKISKNRRFKRSRVYTRTI